MFRSTYGMTMLAGVILLTLVAMVSSCQGKAQPASLEGSRVGVNNGYYTNVTAQQLAVMLKNKDFVFINVHIPYDGEIEKTDLLIPYNQIEQNLHLLPQDKNAAIVVYCRTGPMSAIAAKVLADAGYTSIWNLEGGMGAWKQQGFEVIHRTR